MQLLTLVVQNWVHHRYRKCDFTRGLVGILGENGSGKSSLFGAISWLLTGENPNFGVKADNVSQYAKPDEPAFATLEFEHNGHYASVTRYLLPEKEQAILTLDSKEVARGDRAVTAGIEKFLGVDAKFISRFIIVPQTEIFSFIDDTKSDTDKFFQRLFNTSKADKCQDIIGKAVAKLNIPEIAVSSAQLLPRIADVTKDLAEREKEVAALPSFDDYIRMQEGEQNTINQWQKRQQIAAELDQLDSQEIELISQNKRHEAELAEYEKDLNTFVAATSGGEDEHREAKIALGHWANYKKISELRDGLAARRAAIAADRRANAKPEAPAEHTSVALRDEINDLERALAAAKEFVSIFAISGVAECPTCHTPAANLVDQVANEKSNISLIAELLTQKKKMLADALLAEHKFAAWEKIKAKLDAQEAEIVAAEEKIVLVQPPPQTEEELVQTVADFEDFNKALAELRPLVDASKSKIAELAGELRAVQAQKERAREELTGISVTEADAHLATNTIEKIREAVLLRQRLDEERVQIKYSLDALQTQHDEVVQNEQRAKKYRQLIEIADTARDALKNAPRLVAQRNLKKLESAINELLQIFGVNFFVSVADSTAPSFIAEFYDGRKQTAQRLSIGQKTVLALAFRVAVNAQFAEEIGLLALDEPTASLDAPRIKALAPVLEKLRDLSTTKGLQCLLVTHAASLSHLFESTIELEPPELRHGDNR